MENGVFVGILKNDRILLIERIYGEKKWWGLPGGILQFPETLEECAVREARGKTGLDIRIKKMVGAYARWKNPGIAILFEAEITGGTIARQTDKTSDCRFFAKADTPKNVYPAQKILIEDTFLKSEKAVWDFHKDRGKQIN